MKKLILAVAVLAALASCSKAPKSIYKEVSRPCSTAVSTTATTTMLKMTGTSSMTTTQTTTTTTAETTSMTEIEPITMTEIITSEAVTDVVVESEPIVEPEPITTGVSSATYLGEWQAVWYTARDMSYSYNPCGASGNQLISGYSVACDNLPFGTRLLIESEYFTKEVRVDDCGVAVNNVLDLYYFDRSEIPDGLRQAGRIPIKVSIIN